MVLFVSLIAGLVTGLGAIIAILLKNPSEKILSLSLGFASGIMIGISTFSLIPESLNNGNLFTCVLGFICGASFLWIIDALLPHIHKTEVDCDMYLKMGYFIAFGIALHNLPEGLAIGVSKHVSLELSMYTALSIGIHNIAEGLSVAMPLCLGKAARLKIIYITSFTGLATFFGAIIGILMSNVSLSFISFTMAFAAGAMVYISSDELIPHSHSVHSHFANVGIIAGFALALLL